MSHYSTHPLENKTEISLDQRQIFLLFFSCSLFLGLVFALGIVVGKRMTFNSDKNFSTDPLSMLDAINASKGSLVDAEELTYHENLTAEKQPMESGDKRAAGTTQEAHAPSPASEKQSSAATTQQASLKTVQVKTKREAETEATAKATESIIPKAPEQVKSESRTGRFTLQLSSFQDKDEAERFMAKLRSAKLKPYLILSQIPDRGTWYRVRVGKFRTWDEAVSAKDAFEQEHKLVAYVAKH